MTIVTMREIVQRDGRTVVVDTPFDLTVASDRDRLADLIREEEEHEYERERLEREAHRAKFFGPWQPPRPFVDIVTDALRGNAASVVESIQAGNALLRYLTEARFADDTPKPAPYGEGITYRTDPVTGWVTRIQRPVEIDGGSWSC